MSDFKLPPSVERVISALRSRVAALENTRGTPRYTTATLPDATTVEGLQVYDTTTQTMKYSNGTAWVTL